jgi:hypothetical protein
MYAIGVQPVGGFTSTVMLATASPSPSLTVHLGPALVTLPAQATLVVTDSHPGPLLLPGLWFTLPVTATAPGVTQTLNLSLLVGGARVWLPLVLR